MPKDPETGEAYDSPKDALAAALPEGTSAEEVLSKLEDMGYSLEPSGDATLDVAIDIEAEDQALPEEEIIDSALAEEDVALDPGGAPSIGEEDPEGLSMGMMGPPEGMAKKRDKVAEGLMDRFKKGMV